MQLGETATKAAGLVTGERNKAYGNPSEDYGRSIRIYKAIKGHTNIEKASDGILFMLCVKLSREQNAHSEDNLVDACGYIDLLNAVKSMEQSKVVTVGVINPQAPYIVGSGGVELERSLKDAFHQSMQKDSGRT